MNPDAGEKRGRGMHPRVLQREHAIGGSSEPRLILGMARQARAEL